MAVVCLAIAVAMPAMEVIPIVANVAGAAFIAFGLSLIAHDGLLALLGFVLTVLTVAVGVYVLL